MFVSTKPLLIDEKQKVIQGQIKFINFYITIPNSTSTIKYAPYSQQPYIKD